MSKVGIAVCDEYNIDKVKRAINTIINKTDFPSAQGKTVLIKPNILQDADPARAITTHPVVLQAMIQILKDKGAARIYVGDSPALPGKNFHPNKSGIQQVITEEEVEEVDFGQNPKTIKLEYTRGSLKYASVIDSVDFSISLCKFKTHELMFATGAVKNMFGLVPGLNKSRQHALNPTRKSFAKVMCSVFKEAKVEYALMDAIIGMEGHGPASGSPRQIDKLIGGADAVAVDIAQAIMMGYDPNKIPIISFALNHDLTGTNSIESVTYPLLNAYDLQMMDYIRIGDSNTAEAHEESEHMLRPVPEFDDDKCIGCLRCVEICPAQALAYTNHIEIDTLRCVRCYCCGEVCPVKAITTE